MTEYNKIKDIAVIIPSLNPDGRLVELVAGLKEYFSHILVVDDGSGEEYESYYKNVRGMGADVLRHCVNMGKGRAIKDACNYLAIWGGGVFGAVCVDSDGQHAIGDIVKCARVLSENPDSLILGCRDFKQKGIPFRSRFGNHCTRRVMKLLCGIDVQDTQTGLRGMSCDVFKQFLNTAGERYEYEMNVLVETKEKGIPIVQVPIQTIYIDGNESSHFNPLVDSFRIYRVFLKFIFASFSSFLIDITLFTAFLSAGRRLWSENFIFTSTCLARVCSSFYNYRINRNKVFRVSPDGSRTLIRYYLLCAVQMLISGLAMKRLFLLWNISGTLLKIFVDTILFFIGFQIQREWVFRKTERRR